MLISYKKYFYRFYSKFKKDGQSDKRILVVGILNLYVLSTFDLYIINITIDILNFEFKYMLIQLYIRSNALCDMD